MNNETFSPDCCFGLVRHLLEFLKLLHHIATQSISDSPSSCGVDQQWPIKSVDWVGPCKIMLLSAVEFKVDVKVEVFSASSLGLTLQGQPCLLAGRKET